MSEVGMYYRGKVEGFSSPRSFQTYEHLIHLYRYEQKEQQLQQNNFLIELLSD